MRKLLAITNALADESRVRTVMALTRGRLCVCQIAELLQLAPSTVSKHLSLLYGAGLVHAQKTGRWVYYSVEAEPDPIARQALEWTYNAIAKDSRIAEDCKRLKLILKEDPEELCRRQLGRSRSCASAATIPADGKRRKDGAANSRTL